jgi:ribosomal protein L37AE/L43A
MLIYRALPRKVWYSVGKLKGTDCSMDCPDCHAPSHRHGTTTTGNTQRWRCPQCHKTFSDGSKRGRPILESVDANGSFTPITITIKNNEVLLWRATEASWHKADVTVLPHASFAIPDWAQGVVFFENGEASLLVFGTNTLAYRFNPQTVTGRFTVDSLAEIAFSPVGIGTVIS